MSSRYFIYLFGRIPRRPYSSIIRKASTGRRGSGFPGVRYHSRALLLVVVIDIGTKHNLFFPIGYRKVCCSSEFAI